MGIGSGEERGGARSKMDEGGWGDVMDLTEEHRGERMSFRFITSGIQKRITPDVPMLYVKPMLQFTPVKQYYSTLPVCSM